MQMNLIDNDLLSIQEARILAENAKQAQTRLLTMPQEKLDCAVRAMAKVVAQNAKVLAMESVDETDYGNWQDKLIKNRFVSEYLPMHLEGMRCVGVISRDPQTQIMEIGVPLGVLVALPPATNPVSTSVYKALIAIKSGNAIIFSPHPRAKKVTSHVLELMIEAAMQAGLPEGAVSYLQTVTKAGTEALMNHPFVSMVMVTGVPGMLEAAKNSGKPVIYGGAGNGPAFIERSADIEQAARDIVASKTFDYGVVSAAEQSIVVDGPIEKEVHSALERHGGYFLNEEEAARLGKIFYFKDGTANPEAIGKSALSLAKWAKIDVPVQTKVLIVPQRYVSAHNPYSKEKLCPVLSYFIEDDWMNACEKCIELLITERSGHTLVIHSKDEAVIEQFALKKPVGRMLINTPAVYGSMGMTTNLFPAMTLGSGVVGQGITTDNVSPMNLIYKRKIGYGVRRIEELGVGAPAGSDCRKADAPEEAALRLDTLRTLLEEALKNVRSR